MIRILLFMTMMSLTSIFAQDKTPAKTTKKRRSHQEVLQQNDTIKRIKAYADHIQYTPHPNPRIFKYHQMLEATEWQLLFEPITFEAPEAVNQGEMLTYLATSEDGYWVQVRVNSTGTIGLVSIDMVK